MYFKYYFPDVSELTFLAPDLRHKYEETVHTVAARMDTLEEALEMTDMEGPVFAATAKKLFDAIPEAFDLWSAESLADHVRMMYSPETPVYEHLDFPNATTVVDSAFVHTKEWEALRHIGIGGSDSSVIMGVSEWTDPLELYYEKIGKPELIPSKDNKQAIFDRGHILEERVIDSFCKLTGAKRTHETRMFISKKYPHVTANPDEILIFPDGRVYVYEAKTTDKQNAYKWANNRIPAYYVTQTRQYPGVLDDDRIVGTYIGCHFIEDFTLAGNYVGSAFEEKQFVSREVERDRDEEIAIMVAEETFWNTYIVPCKAPPSNADADERIRILRTYLIGQPDVSLPGEKWRLIDYQAALDAYNEIHDRRMQLEHEAAELKEQEKLKQIPFITALGKVTCAEIPIDDDQYWEVKNAPKKKSKSVDWERLEVAYPEAYSECVTTNEFGSPIFSIRQKKYKKKKA